MKVHDHRFGSFTDEVLDYAQNKRLAVWAYTPLLSGRYTREDRPLPEHTTIRAPTGGWLCWTTWPLSSTRPAIRWCSHGSAAASRPSSLSSE